MVVILALFRSCYIDDKTSQFIYGVLASLME